MEKVRYYFSLIDITIEDRNIIWLDLKIMTNNVQIADDRRLQIGDRTNLLDNTQKSQQIRLFERVKDHRQRGLLLKVL